MRVRTCCDLILVLLFHCIRFGNCVRRFLVKILRKMSPFSFILHLQIFRYRVFSSHYHFLCCTKVYCIHSLRYSSLNFLQIGKCVFPKYKSHMQDGTFQDDSLYILHRSLRPLESLLTCLQMNWLALLVSFFLCQQFRNQWYRLQFVIEIQMH